MGRGAPLTGRVGHSGCPAIWHKVPRLGSAPAKHPHRRAPYRSCGPRWTWPPPGRGAAWRRTSARSGPAPLGRSAGRLRPWGWKPASRRKEPRPPRPPCFFHQPGVPIRRYFKALGGPQRTRSCRRDPYPDLVAQNPGGGGVLGPQQGPSECDTFSQAQPYRKGHT